MTTTGHVHFYIGTYTNPPSTSTGIARLSLNTETGELTRLDDVVVLSHDYRTRAVYV